MRQIRKILFYYRRNFEKIILAHSSCMVKLFQYHIFAGGGCLLTA